MDRLIYLCYFSLLSLVCIPFNLGAQLPDLSFDHFGFKEGLSNLSIQCLHEDKKGYLWVGTYNGLFRYDGYEFKHYVHQPFDSSSLAANDIKDIAETREGKLFIGMQGGISQYHWQSNEFTQIKDAQDSLRLIRIKAMCVDSLDRVWASQRFNPRINGYIENGTSLVRKFTSTSRDLLAVKEGLWVAKATGLFFYHFEQDSLYEASEYKEEISLPKVQTNILLMDQRQVLWIGTAKGLYRYDEISQEFQAPKPGSPLEAIHVTALCEDHLGRIWVGTDNGLILMDAQRTYQGIFQYDPNDERGLEDNQITSLEQDRAGNLWIGTFKRGLHKLRLKGANPFNAWNSADFGFGVGQVRVYAFAESKNNNLWIGTNVGLFLLDRENKQILLHIKSGKKDSLGLSHPMVRTLYENDQGQVLIGLQYTGINIYDSKKHSMWHMPNQMPVIKPSQVRNIFQDSYKEDRYWLIGNLIHHFTLSDTSFYHHTLAQGPGIKALSAYSWEGKQIHENQLLIANQKGLLHLYPKEDSAVLFPLFPSSYIAEHQAISISPTQKGEYWLGTYADGLMKSDAAGNILQSYSRLDGLDNNVIIGIIQDSSKHIWLSTGRGISRFDPQTKQFQNYHIQDGIHGEEFETGAYLKTSDGEIYFGGADGFTSFYPGEIEDKSNYFQPALYLTEVNISGPETYEENQALTFTSYLGQQLEIRFVALDLSQPQKIRYQWYLEGYEDDWQSPTYERRLKYANLPPGDYQFHLRASNGDGVFSGASLDLQIQVKARLVQTWWFKLGIPMLLLLLTAFSVYTYVSRLRYRERKRLKNRIASMRQRALASQMNRHFTFNSLNSIQRFIVENNSKSALYYISRFGKLMRNMLNQSRQNIIGLDEELQTLELFLSLEKMRSRDSFDYVFQVDPDLEPALIEIPSGLLQPYVENAIWHGLMPLKKQGLLTIAVRQKTNILEVHIIDNGIGRLAAEERKRKERPQHKSQGMEINQERIQTLNSLYDWEIKCQTFDVQDDDGNVGGTQVQFDLPLI